MDMKTLENENNEIILYSQCNAFRTLGCLEFFFFGDFVSKFCEVECVHCWYTAVNRVHFFIFYGN